MNPLDGIIRNQITQSGAIDIAKFMHLCLYHPEHGYYRHANAIGAQEDFITAPEISQAFGELIGLCLAQAWHDQGAPKYFNLLELGAGSGCLMADALRATKDISGFHDALCLHLVESNQTLRKQQKNRLGAFDPQWHFDQTKLPDGPLFVIANEFFDCLPIRQFIRTDKGWVERMVGEQDNKLCFVQSRSMVANALGTTAGSGDWLELRPAANALIADLSQQIEQNGGAALIIDYGDWGSHANTLQALYKHQKSAPLNHLGRSDLTAWVDFAALAKAADCCAHSELTPQGVFLERLGITARMQALSNGLSATALENHIAAHERLCHPDKMGNLFKVLGLWPKAAPSLAGLT